MPGRPGRPGTDGQDSVQNFPIIRKNCFLSDFRTLIRMALADHRDHPVRVTLSVLVTFPVFLDERESLEILEQLEETERLDGTEKTVNRECPVNVDQTVYLDLPDHPGKFPSSRLTVIVVRDRNFNLKILCLCFFIFRSKS